MIHKSFLNRFSSPDPLFRLWGKHKRGPLGTTLSQANLVGLGRKCISPPFSASIGRMKRLAIHT